VHQSPAAVVEEREPDSVQRNRLQHRRQREQQRNRIPDTMFEK